MVLRSRDLQTRKERAKERTQKAKAAAKAAAKARKEKTSKGHAMAAGGEPEAESSPIKDQSGEQSKPARKQKTAEAAKAKAGVKPP